MHPEPLTIFACPRAFEGPFAVIQWNAIRSWTLLEPKPTIILFGDDKGTAEIAREFGLRHEPEIQFNENGTPLVDDLFARADQLAKTTKLVYINADIILMSDFSRALQFLNGTERPFVMVGQRWDLDVNERLTFENGWEDRLRARALREGKPYGPGGADYFVYRKGFWGEILPFALGRFLWDNWLLFQVRAKDAWLVDATPVVLAVHQNHFYPAPGGKPATARREEVVKNLKMPRQWHLHTIREASHRLTPRGLKRSITGTLRLFWRHYIWVNGYWHPFLERTRSWRHALGLRSRKPSD